MKQKIVIKLQMDCNKCRNKALKIAAEVPGVTAVALDGDDNDCVAVTGENVDTVCLANQLKKKFRSVTILTVEDLKKAAEEKKKKEEAEKKKKEEAEAKKKKEEERMKKLLCAAMCNKCNSSTCHGKCETLKCHSTKCDGECVILCLDCESPQCECLCKLECSNCHSSKCNGCKPPSPCPKWCTCSKCYVPYQPCYYPSYPPPVICYDSCPDSNCSIMASVRLRLLLGILMQQ
ncbi:Heavy metal-associated isoprenylated plant protein 47, partial [Mucuna pruriens]